VDDISINEVLSRDGSLTSVSTFCSGLSPVEVVLKNLGADTIKKAKISWTMNGVSQTAALLTGLSIPKGGQQTVSLGNYNFSGSSFTINARCDTINDSVDQNHSNDTIAKTQSLGMAGIYTIGGSSPDFTTFNAAKNALYSRGLCGNVVFNVRSGTYNERIYFNGSLQGASSTATVRFRPDPVNTSPATLRYSSDYTLRFGGGVSYVAFDSLNLETSFGNVVEMYSENDHISFNGNNIKGYLTSSTSNSYALFYLYNGKYTRNFSVTNNKCTNGSSAVYAYNSYSGYNNVNNMMDSIEINGNEFKDFAYAGLYMQGYKYVNVRNNTISNRSSGGYFYPYGIYYYYVDFVDIVSNKITVHNTSSYYSRGLHLNYCDGSSSNRNLIANNMISAPTQESTSSGSSDYLNSCNYSDIVYNSWYGKFMNTSTSYGMVRLYYGASVNFSNNNMFNDGGAGNTIRIYGSPTEKNNNYYNTNTSKRRYPASGGTNNVNVDPGFISSTDLHATGIGIYQKGDPFLGVTNDIDGDTRHVSTPCIGADEFFIPARDASAKEVVYSPSCPGTRTILARIENKGLDTLTSFNVDWSVSTNGGSLVPKSQVSWSGVLPSGKDTVITLGNITMLGTDLYGIQVRTSSPNGSTDQNLLNDTTYKEVQTAMSGTFTIGGLSPDFVTPQSAVAALKLKGLCGPVVFDIRPGTYQGQLKLQEITGASAVNTITWRGSGTSNTTLAFTPSGSNYTVIDINGTDHMTFKNLRVHCNTSTLAYAKNFRLYNNADHITIDSCLIEQNNNINYQAAGVAVSNSITSITSGQLCHDLTISNCLFNGMDYGIGYQGQSTTVLGNKLLVENNTFTNIDAQAIDIYYADSVTIHNNVLTDNVGYGIGFRYNKNYSITNNKVVAKNSYALYHYRNNYYLSNSSNIAEIYNNFFSANGTVEAVYTRDANYLKFYHNSCRAKSDYAFYDYFGTAKKIQNNIFYSESSYAWYSASTTTSYLSTLDNNLYYRANSASVAYFQGAKTLAAWQTYRTSLNTVSAVGDPKFVSSTDLRIANGKLADSLGAAGLGVTKDIFDSLRNVTHPDAGAYEFDYQPIDGDLVALIRPSTSKMCLSASDTLEFAVVNRGGDTINLSNNGISISWSVSGPNNISGTDALNTGTLAPNDTAYIVSANTNVNLSDPGTYTIRAAIISSWDKYADNDSIEVELERIATEKITAVKDTTIYYRDSIGISALTDLDSVQVLISEVSQYSSSFVNGAPNPKPSYIVSDDYVEITAGPNTDLSGFTLELWYTTLRRINYTLPAGAKTNSEGTLIIGTASTAGTNPAMSYFAANTSSSRTSGNASGRVLKDPSGNIVDAVAYGAYVFPASSGVTAAHWAGSTGSPGNTAGIKRVNGPDNNTNTNWVVVSNSNRQTPNGYNPNMKQIKYPPSGFQWAFNGSLYSRTGDTIAGPWSSKGTKDYIASFVSPCSGNTNRDTAQIIAYSANLVISGEANEYYSYPLSQSQGIKFSGSVKNLGDSISNIRTYVTMGGNAVGDTLVSSGMARFGDSTFNVINSGLNTTVGSKSIVYYLNTTDDFVNDDTAKTNLMMTDSVMARDNGSFDRQISEPTVPAFGHRYTVYNKDTVTGAMIHVSQAFPGDKFKTELYALNGNSVGAKLNESGDFTILSTSDTGWKYVRLNCLSVLDSGDYLLTITKTSTVFSSSFGYTNTNGTQGASFAKIGGAWNPVIINGQPFNLGLRMVFGSYEYPTFSALNPVCESGSKMSLYGGMPTGGSYFGTGVSNDTLDPKMLTAGSNVISYQVSNGKGCMDTISSTVEVKTEPTITSSFTQLTSCTVGNAAISVSASNVFGNVSYSINNGSSFQSSGTFVNLSSGPYTIVVKDSVCVVTDSTYVATPPGAPNKPNASGGSVYCKGDALNKIQVSTTTSGATGIFKWYKDGALTQSHGIGDSIAPSDTTMTQVYFVIEDRLGCLSAADTTSVTINPLPVVTNTALANRCTNEDTVILRTGTPTGGTYSGTGVSNNTFVPSSAGAGSHVITYSYTDGNNCTNSDTAGITIYQAPVTSLASQGSSCTNAQSYSLTGGTPTGGTYSGFGVSLGMFDPNNAGIGLHTIQYKVTNTNCADSASATIRVHLAPVVSVTSLADRCEDASNLTLAIGSPSGGIYSGNGISSGVFNPSSAGPGSHTVKYVYTDNNMCSDSANTTAWIDSLPAVSFGALSNVCANSPAVLLTQGSGSPGAGTGTYFGTGVSNSDFDPLVSGAGAWQLGYAYVDTNGCVDTAYSTQNVDTVPSVAWTSNLSNVCKNTAQFTLSGATPTGGVYKGAGVFTSGRFIPDSAGSGTHSIRYVFTDGNGCKDSVAQNQLVHPLPVLSMTLPINWCMNDKPIALNMALPSGGRYTINGISDTIYKATVSKLDTIVYEYTDSNRCTNWDTSFIQADTVPIVTFTSLIDVCINSGAINFSQGSPAGGFYTGNRIRLTRVYDPIVATTDTIMYHFVDSNNCADSAAQTQVVHPLPIVTLASQTDVCQNTPLFALSGGIPAGGVYKGKGVSGADYNASQFGTGTDVITYVFVDGNNCTDSASQNLVVHDVTPAKFNYMFPVCENGDTFDLTQYGVPGGGIFKGPGVSGNSFVPTSQTVGNHNLTYVFTNSNNCQDSAMRDIEVQAAPQFSLVGIKLEGCNNSPAIVALDTASLRKYQVKWGNGSQGDTAFVKRSGDLWVKVIDPNTDKKCFRTDTIKGITFSAICVGMAENLSSTEVKYYPNPNQGTFNYELVGFEGLDIDVSIQSLSGQAIYNDSWSNVSGMHTGQIQVTAYESGVYFITLNTKRGRIMHRITINS
jgi:hypothetical protein